MCMKMKDSFSHEPLGAQTVRIFFVFTVGTSPLLVKLDTCFLGHETTFLGNERCSVINNNFIVFCVWDTGWNWNFDFSGTFSFSVVYNWPKEQKLILL